MVLSVFAISVAFTGSAAAGTAGNAASVTAEAMDTTNTSATSNITVVQEANSNTDPGDAAIAISGASSQPIVAYDSAADPSTNPGLEAIYIDGNETTFEVNSSEFGADFELGEGLVEADGESGGGADATARVDTSTSVALNGLDVTSTSGPRVAANDTEVEYSVTVNNTGSQSVTQDVSLVVSNVNDTINPSDQSTYTVLETNSSVTVGPGEEQTLNFTAFNTGQLTGANENINDFEVAGFTSGSPIGFAPTNLKVGSSTTGSVSLSVLDDGSNRQEGVTVELWVESDFDDDSLIIREGTTNANGEVTFTGLAVGSDDDNPIRYTARAGNDSADLGSTTTTLELYETTQTSESSTVIVQRLVQPERIEVEPDLGTAIADGSDQITYTATVYGGVDGVPGSSDDRPIEGFDVTVTDNGDSITYDPAGNVVNGDYVEATNEDGEVTFSVSSDVVQTADFDVSVGDGSGELSETVQGRFILSGEGRLAGTVNNDATTNPIEDASVWLVDADNYEANENLTTVDLSAVGSTDDTIWIRLRDNETGSILNNDDYDLRSAEEETDGEYGTYVRKVNALNESDAAVGQGYALVDSDGDGEIQFNHTRIEDEDYYAQVSFNAENSSAGAGTVDDGTEDFVNVTSITGSANTVDGIIGNDPVVFEPTANLTLEQAENFSETTDIDGEDGANFVDSPGFVNSFGYDTEGTTATGRFVLNRLPTDYQNGTQYVAIATNGGFSTDFADVYVDEDGQLSFNEGQGSNEFFLEPVEVDPDGVDIQQVGTRASLNDPLTPFNDTTDATYQEVPRDGSTVDVFQVNTTADGQLVNATTTVSFDTTAVDGEFVAIAGGEFVSIDNASNSATLYTGSDGQAEVWYQTDEGAETIDTQKRAVLDADSSAVDTSNVTFVGVKNFGSASISGIVTDSADTPLPNSAVWTRQFSVGSGFNPDRVVIEPTAADRGAPGYSEAADEDSDTFTVELQEYNTTSNEYETVNNDTTTAGDLRSYSFSEFPSLNAEQPYKLYQRADESAGEEASYTFEPVPALEGTTDPTDYRISAVRTTGDNTPSNDALPSVLPNTTATANVVIPITVNDSDLQVSGVEDQTIAEGENTSVTATISNTGGSLDTIQTITLSVDGTVVNSTEVTVASGTTQTVELTGDTSDLSAGEYTISVASDDDSDDANLTVTSDDAGSGNWYDSYVNDSNVVDDGGLNQAVSDALAGDLSDERLNAVISSYLSGDPIETNV